eukprot:ANDGO_04504.mRNA.1 Acetylcholinesterase
MTAKFTVFMVVVLAAMCSAFADPSLIVRTSSGLYEGITAPNNSQVFRWTGIPFAAPPIGNLRWKSPMPYNATDFTTVRSASSFGASCPQVNYYNPSVTAFMSEDCLSLNIWSPVHPSNVSTSEPLPVIFWMYGGGFFEGGTVIPDYDGTNLVAMRKSVVFVSANYRLGAYGFASSTSLDAESGPRNASGLYGMEDQRAAMQWVRDNIRKFGGNPNKVTLMGESAGSFFVCFHLASPLSSGLFHAGIMESGSCELLDDFFKVHKTLKQVTDLFASKTRCGSPSNLACLRSLSISEIANATIDMNANVLLGANAFIPDLDGFNLPKYSQFGISFSSTFSSGSFNKVPLLIGFNQHEQSLFLLGDFVGNPANVTITQATYDAIVASQDGGDPRVRNYYSAERFAAWDPQQPLRGAVVALLTHKIFGCPSRRLATAVSQNGVPVYMYQFNHAPVNGIYGNYSWMGAYHYAEIPFVFGNPNDEFHYVRSFTPSEAVLSKRAMGYWLSFAESAGNPNYLTTERSINDPTFVTAWPPYNSDTDLTLELEARDALRVRHKLLAEPCSIWDDLQPARSSAFSAAAVCSSLFISALLSLFL